MASCMEELQTALEGKLRFKRMNTALQERIAALKAELEEERGRVEAWHGNSDEWQAESARLRELLRSRAGALHYLRHHHGTFGVCSVPECVEARAALEE